MTPDDGFDLEALLDAFRSETEENLGEMETALLRLEASPRDPELLHTIFRAAHTLKGGAATVGVDTVVEFAHRIEELLDRLRLGQFVATPAVISLLLRSVDHLRQTVGAAIGGDHDAVREPSLMAGLAQAIETGSCDETPVAQIDHLDVDQQAATLRVPAVRLDAIVNATGEIAIARGRLRTLIEALQNTPQALLDVQEHLDRLADELQSHVLRLRMVTLEPVFRRCARQVRDVARAQGKLVQLQISGEEVDIDTSIAEQLRDVLLHVVRNAVDHGIEPPQQRMESGKPMSGTLTLRAWHDAGMIAVEVSDDGRGLDRARILARGIELGLVDRAASSISDADMNRLVFSPGFSTAERVTEVSGRGVGMDVVQRKITELRGSVALRSEAGKGTSIVFRLPLTIAIIDSLAVRAGEETFVLPLDYVTECIDVDAAAIGEAASGLTDVRGRAVPFLRLSSSFGVPSDGGHSRRSLVLVRHGDVQAGIVLDELLGRVQAVLKPLDGSLPRHAGIGGATVLGDGSVAFVLDVPRLLQHHLKEVA